MTDITHTNDPELIEADATGHTAHDGDHRGGTDHDDAHDHGPTNKQFVTIFLILAAITAVEVLVSYLDIGALFLPILLGLMMVKFLTVVLYFMHVKFDNKIFGRVFYVGLTLAIAVYSAVLATFHFFTG